MAKNTFNAATFYPAHLLPEGARAAALALTNRLIRIGADGELSGDAVQELGQASPSALASMARLIERLSGTVELKDKYLTIPRAEDMGQAAKEWDGLQNDTTAPTARPAQSQANTGPTLDASAIYAARAAMVKV